MSEEEPKRRREPVFDLLPPSLHDLLAYGKAEQKISWLGHQWIIGSLNQAEKRAVAVGINGFDALAKSNMIPEDTLVFAILEVDQEKFREESSKVKLRALLSYASPYVIEKLYDHYIQVMKFAESELDAKILELQQGEVKSPFGDVTGLSSGQSEPKVLETKTS